MRPLNPCFTTKVVGVSFTPDYPANVFALEHRLRFDEIRFNLPPTAVPVRARPDPDNPVDPEAVAIVDDELGHLGYLPAALAARLTAELAEGASWVADVTNVLVHHEEPHQPGIELRLTRVA